MKLSSLLMLVFCVNLSATTLAQEAKMSVEVTNGNIRQVIEAIKAQSDYTFVYNAEELDEIGAVSVNERNADVREILDACLAGTGFTYTIIDRVIVIKKAPVEAKARQQQEVKKIKGRVTDKDGEPLPGVSVLLKGTSFGVATDIDGRFELVQPQDTTGELILSFVGMKTQTVKWTQGKEVNVVMEAETETLDDVVITGYQKVDRRKSTASVTSKTMDELMIPGASSLDQMLMGQIPDMMVMSNSGEVGVVPKLRIRGTSTLIGNREPLWVVDGIVVQDPVEIAPEELNDPDYINRIGNAIAGLNPQDIERIDVLKDAAATALYGTKAANGVIVITTKKGHIGKPIITYNATVTMRQRPRYTDRNINVMNSAERIQFSRELVAAHYDYPEYMNMVGYEGLLNQLYNKEIDYGTFEQEVRKLEEMNTDWFDILTEDSFSHQHTVSITGGSEEGQYYASIGYSRDNDVIKGDHTERYTAVLNLDANLAPWMQLSLGLNGNVTSRSYYQSEIAPIQYAYRTSRAIPAYDDNGEYYYYKKQAEGSSSENYRFNYNILNELENSSLDQEGQSLTATVNLQFDIRDWLKASAILSYSASHTTIQGWWGEKTFHAAELRQTEYGTLPTPAEWYYDDYYEEYTYDKGWSELPYGGELSQDESDNRSYTVRLQGDVNKSFGAQKQHNIFGSVGFELSSTRYKEYSSVTRGYYKDRGMTFVTNIDPQEWPYYAQWVLDNPPTLTDSKTNTVSWYASASYSYFNYFTANINGRIDGSNGFGDQSNDKLLPIWSASANWNISEHAWMARPWIDLLRLKFSFGYQGNMLSDQTPVMIIQKEPLDAYYNENTASVERYPNPDLKWETTTSYNLGLEFSLFRNRFSFEGELYWKHTKDAFMTKTISAFNGVEGNSYAINGGDVDNNGYSVALTVSPINNDKFRWTLSTSWSETFNNVDSEADSQTYELDDFLSGEAIVEGEAVGTFYSYKFMGLSPVDGGPIFDDGGDNKQALDGLSKLETFTRVLEASGVREPKISGSINTTIRYQNFRLSGSFAYSLGNKVRMFSMYSGENYVYNSTAFNPEYNVHKDYLKRWKKPGDEKTTNIPAIFSQTSDSYYKYETHWSDMENDDILTIAESAWDMYDYGNQRVVSGNYLKCSNLSVTYEFGDAMLKKMGLTRLALTLSGANLFTICAKELDGQAPTQSGFANIQLSDRPMYSFGLTVSF